jgi:hypothetical protein
MGKFLLEISFDSQPHSAGADRAIIGMALAQARHAVRSTAQMEGELKIRAAHAPDPVKIGRWKIEL